MSTMCHGRVFKLMCVAIVCALAVLSGRNVHGTRPNLFLPLRRTEMWTLAVLCTLLGLCSSPITETSLHYRLCVHFGPMCVMKKITKNWISPRGTDRNSEQTANTDICFQCTMGTTSLPTSSLLLELYNMKILFHLGTQSCFRVQPVLWSFLTIASEH